MFILNIIKHVGNYLINKIKSAKELPGYFDAQKYVEDKIKTAVEFQVYFLSSARIKNSTIDAKGISLNLEQIGANFRIVFSKKISDKLFNDLIYGNFRQHWILSYIVEILPYINKEILEQRYKYAYYLLKTFTAQDILQIRLINKKTQQGSIINGPVEISEIPLPETIKYLHNIHLYFRDFVDAVNAYFNANYEDSIRRFITSVENFKRHYNIQRKTKASKSEFIDAIRQNIHYKCPIHNKYVAEDIIDIYLIRNAIVHQGRRIDPLEGKEVCKKAIHAILDVYKQFGDESDPKEYANNLELQFVANEGFLSNVSLSNM